METNNNNLDVTPMTTAETEYLSKVFGALNNVSEEVLKEVESKEKAPSQAPANVKLKPGMIIVLKGCFPPPLNSSLSNEDATIGHTAIVSEDITKLIEAVDYGGDDGKGRVRVSNYRDFFSKKGTYYWLWPSDKKTSDCEGISAASYANEQLKKPYNHNYLNKWSDKEFYCSALCWRSWYEQKIHIGTTYIIPWVAPNDLISFGTTIINKWRNI